MFERFTEKARLAVVGASEEARELQHDYIGTEHILLGLLRQSDAQSARALARLGVSADGVRRDVVDRVGVGEKPPTGHIPFTPELKATLEQSLREAMALQHSFIGTEHLLLALAGQTESRGAQILAEQVGDILEVRTAVLDQLTGREGAGAAPGDAARRTMRIRVSDDQVMLQISDLTLVELARAAVAALGDHVDEPGTIRGDLPAATSFATLWEAVRDSLKDVQRRAANPPPSGRPDVGG
ncbi:hypothetical protein GBP94_22000 [Mycobacterium avium subsp. hominissuis]|uniref:Clp R domain-containing protein n=1 Tax=Mycobacterium kiyosense TaxID=2871094 RepID=A0AA37QB19_9MYCO|nr:MULTISPECIES: Clp protease N-terminal domain-containing protein [Mycobacterium]MBZ4632043.1 hypothetical protein [Mycobacterium avium subsp. hominissuis]GLB87054.1 hypothetical protein SRL2020028_63100 [Mycobacterium kiyosense]